MEKIKFEAIMSNKDSVVVEDSACYMPDICRSFRGFLVASGFDYVDYRYLARLFKELHDERSGK